MKTEIYLLLVFFIAPLCLSAQQDVPFDREHFPDQRRELREAVDNFHSGIVMLEDNRVVNALEFFEKAYDFNPDNADLNHLMGKSYRILHQVKPAIKHLSKAYELGNKGQRAFYAYEYAEAMHLAHKFDKAILYYKEHLQSLTPEEMKLKRDFLQKKIEECNTGKELVRDSIRVFIELLAEPVNSSYPEYSPYVNADETKLFFTSRRPGTTGGDFDDVSNGYFEDIYVSEMENGQWSAPENVGKPLNTKYHDAVVGLSPDGQKLYSYRWKNGGDVFESKLEGDVWTKPEELDKPVNSKYHEPTASFTYDGRGIFVVSDREGGYGGSDIYYVEKDNDGEWKQAVNLGPAINTKFDEDGVFMHPDGKTLYFSSKGHKTMGGYDIFKAVKEDGEWSEPENLGYPINTADDDIFFSVTASGRYGYYSSSRRGNQDIYRIHFLGPSKPLVNSSQDQLIAMKASEMMNMMETAIEVESPNLTLLKGIVLDEETKEPVKAALELVDNESGKVLAEFVSNSKTGRYLVSLPAGRNYGIAVKAEAYLFHSENFNIPDKDTYREVEKNILLKKIKIGKSIVLNNVFFDFDVGDEVKKESEPELNRVVKLLNTNPDLKVEISGHTDNIGSDEYNKKLSLERAKTVVEYLVSKGIDQSRLSYKGYGSTKPVAENDTEEGRQKNRRTEFKIVGE